MASPVQNMIVPGERERGGREEGGGGGGGGEEGRGKWLIGWWEGGGWEKRERERGGEGLTNDKAGVIEPGCLI